MATSTQQKQELFKAIWATAEDLRNSVDGWDFKSYVLGILFYRFISENITTYLNHLQAEAGEPDFNYEDCSDERAEDARTAMVEEKGFFILPSQLFCNVRRNAKNDENLNITLDKIFKSIEASAIGTPSEPDLKGLFADIDVNSNKLGGTVAKRNEQLTKILNNIGNIDLKGEYHENQIDVFGDAYEFLMTMYASNAGKSGGEFFTPQEVSELLARIVSHGRATVNKVYDPACGSGSLLLQFAKVLGKDNVRKGFYGQELNITTYNLCRINMFLHDINYTKFQIYQGDTLIDPQHMDEEPFDAIVSNPPYSTKWIGDDSPTLINDQRFAPAGVLAPKSKSDLAFTMHMLSWLSTEGTAAIVEFPGVLYRGGAEMKIRKYLIDNNYVDTVIQLPANLFFGVSIATCVIVLKKSKRENKTLFIDASGLFVHEGNKNKLSPENIAAIVEEYAERKEVKHFSALVDNKIVADNGYNLSVSSYVEAEDTRPKTDINELNARISKIVEREAQLRTEIDEIIKELED
jgi:type I restriction enzyme M protein